MCVPTPSLPHNNSLKKNSQKPHWHNSLRTTCVKKKGPHMVHALEMTIIRTLKWLWSKPNKADTKAREQCLIFPFVFRNPVASWGENQASEVLWGVSEEFVPTNEILLHIVPKLPQIRQCKNYVPCAKAALRQDLRDQTMKHLRITQVKSSENIQIG